MKEVEINRDCENGATFIKVKVDGTTVVTGIDKSLTANDIENILKEVGVPIKFTFSV